MNTSIQNIPLIQAKKLSQLDQASDIFEIDSANVIVQIPKRDETGNWDGKSYENKKVNIKDFISNSLSTLWKDNYDNDRLNIKQLNNKDLIPIISKNIGDNVQYNVDSQIWTRNDDETLSHEINKSQSVPLDKLAIKIKSILNLIDDSNLQQKLDELNNTLRSRIIEVDTEHSNEEASIRQLIETKDRDLTQSINDLRDYTDGKVSNINTTIQTLDQKHDQDITTVNTNINNVYTYIIKWLIES